MKQKNITKLFSAALLTVCSLSVMTSCHDLDEYIKKPYTVTDSERVSYAEKTFGVKIDPQQDWVLTAQYSVKITADASLEGISEVAVFEGNPLEGENYRLAAKTVAKGETATLSFRTAKATQTLYAVCLSKSGECISRPFSPGSDASVSFIDQQPQEDESASRTRSPKVWSTPQYKNAFMSDYASTMKQLQNKLPKGIDNRNKTFREGDFSNTVKLSKQGQLQIAFIGGNGSVDDNLSHVVYHGGVDDQNNDTILIRDGYPLNGEVERYNPSTGMSRLSGHWLQNHSEDSERNFIFEAGDMLRFSLAKGSNVMADEPDPRVRIFMFNDYVFMACEDGDDWDYNDRLFWFPEGNSRLENTQAIPVEPEPAKAQLWTYAWEDKDFGDYDMNDCVIEAKENAQDPSKIDITLVALGATRNLWLGFENLNAKSYRDYQPVFEKELHEVLGVPAGTMVNTGMASASPVTITLAKPAGFDFQTCSFVLGAKVKEDQAGVYESDFYYFKIATKGQDPHGIVIPGQWQWPTETTCVKDAYPEFNTWSADHTQALDWYQHPVAGKVITR